jgi:hypothetical protein
VAEVVVPVMVRGAGATVARGLRRPAGSSSWPGMTSTDPRQPSLGWPDVRPHASNARPRHHRHAGSGGAGEEQGCGGERAAKASGATGGGGGENAGVVDLSSEELNMNDARNCVFWNETCFPDLLEPIKQHSKS